MLCFSYGSGCAATMYGIRVQGVPSHPPDVLERLRARTPKPVEEALRLVDAFEATYGRFGFEPSHVEGRQDGAYYLKGIDAQGKRAYERHTKARAVHVDRSETTIVTKIELLEDTLTADLMREVLAAVEPGRIHVFTSACEHFNVGGSAGSGQLDAEAFVNEGTKRYAEFCRQLQDACDLPIVTLCHGATRGGGMLFPAVADISLATSDATFGYPEIRRGVLPGIVSAPSLRRLSPQQCRRWMLTGEAFDASEAVRNGFVDSVLGSREEALDGLDTLLERLCETPVDELRARKRIATTGGGVGVAIVEAGRLLLDTAVSEATDPAERTPTEDVVRLSWLQKGVAMLELHDPAHGNRMSRTMALALAAHVRDLARKSADELKVVVLKAAGDHFCVGGEPEAWTDETACGSYVATAASYHQVVSACCEAMKQLPVPTLAVLHGHIGGAGLALALSADWRVCASESRFDVADAEQLFGLASTISEVVDDAQLGALRSAESSTLDAARAAELNLVSSVHDTVDGAVDCAVALAATVASSPTTGIRNTMALTRTSARSPETLARACAEFAGARGLWAATSAVHALPASLDLAEGGVAQLAIPDGTTAEVLSRYLLGASDAGASCIRLALGAIQGLDLVGPGLTGLCEWFQGSRERPATLLVVDGALSGGSGLLLTLLADRVVATKEATFDLTDAPLAAYARMAERIGAQGCARLLMGGRLSSEEAMGAGLVHAVVDSLADVDGVTGGATAVRASLSRGRSPSEALIRDAELAASTRLRDRTTDASPTGMLDGNVARIQLGTAVDLRRRLRDVAVARASGIVIDVGQAGADNGRPTDFGTSVSELRAAYDVCHQLRALPVPVCAVLSGSVSALGLAVGLSSDHRIGVDDVRIDFACGDVAALVFDVTNALTAAVGHAKADSIRFERPVLSAAEACERHLLHSVCVDTTTAVEVAVAYAREGRRLNKSVLPRCDSRLPSTPALSRHC